MRNITQIMFITLFSIFLLSGCATSYQPKGFTGGFSETQLDSNVYRVSFRGNGMTSRTRAADFTLLRCAEISLKKGYGYFVVVSGEKNSNTVQVSSPGSTYSTFDFSGNAISNTYGGETYHVAMPSHSNTILLLRDKPEQKFAYNAQIVYNNLTHKYGIE